MPPADGPPAASSAAPLDASRPGSLRSWRVLITRPAEQAAPFAQALVAAGATPIVYPTITLAPPPSWKAIDQALSRLGEYAWAVFTSPSAVAFTLSRAALMGRAASVLAGVRLAAVGTETARALTDQGLTVALVPAPEQQRQEGLLQAFLAVLPAPIPGAAGARILFPQAVGGREWLRDQLAQSGYAIDVVPVSQTIACDLTEPPPPFDVATFASPSALRAFVERLGSEHLARARVAVIGPTTAAAAAALGVRVDAISPKPSVVALVQALAQLRARLFDPAQD